MLFGAEGHFGRRTYSNLQYISLFIFKTVFWHNCGVCSAEFRVKNLKIPPNFRDAQVVSTEYVLKMNGL